ncbi:TonB-dependent receptor [Sphingomonas sp. MMSM20]|uniref:TonB-dependent receptor n=1 Tax=Sphingomonas lycopersici TaxID=2951807 RepID=UPI0022384579|nr:TonB-dependent receptor [Sphingomonas lycopersici]MCW6531938.1 TonB-dependent receptor [Sphingomonas lycopersici]
MLSRIISNRRIRAALCGGSAIGALICTAAATAQTAPQEAAAPDAAGAQQEVVVTGSRIVRSGFSAPTPVTVVGEERLEQRAITNVGDALNELPSFRALQTPATQQAVGGNIGARVLDLRGLGATRTLVLLDGKRFVPSTTQGTIDVNLIPSSLIERTEVVTGGASAAYGSDAVAGVVNFILDKKLTGFKGSVQAGISQRGDGAEQNVQLAYGNHFAGERGHFIIAGEYNNAKGLGDCYTRSWCPREQLIGNTPAGYAGLPASIRGGPAGTGTLSSGGLIVANSGPLRGLAFNPNGTTSAYDFGTIYGTNPSPLFTLGGTESARNGFLDGILLSPPVERFVGYAHADYQLSDTVKANLDLSYGQVKGMVIGSVARSTVTIQRSNAYLPAGVAAIMDQNGIGSFTLGRAFMDLGGAVDRSDNKTYRAVFSLEGRISDKWRWDAYYQYGRNEFRQDYTGNVIASRVANAADAVNVNGQIVCRINAGAVAADPSCVPLNIFGAGNISPAAAAYIAPSGFQTTNLTEHVVAANVNGALFALPGGDFSIAAGGEYRNDSATGAADALSTANAFWSFNGKAVVGRIEVAEGYVEAEAPILRDLPFAKTLELNGAVRRTHYNRTAPGSSSTSVDATTWKIGGVWAPNDTIRFRATRSRDIRAPNLTELFGPVTLGRTTIVDPANNGAQIQVNAYSGANGQLAPEKADTWTAGAVLSPGFIPGLRLSVDYYDIKLKGAISTLGAQVLVDRCAAGQAALCQYVQRDAAGTLTSVSDVLQNVSEIDNRGIDIEASYRTGLGALGNLDLRLLATHYLKLSIGGVDRTGQTGYRPGTTTGVPDWIIDGTAVWSIGALALNLHGKYIPQGIFDTTLVGPQDAGYSPALANSINNNRVNGRFYLDLGATIKINDRFEMFGVINNLLDKDPPLAASAQGATNQVYFDPIGRYFKFGARVRL